MKSVRIVACENPKVPDELIEFVRKGGAVKLQESQMYRIANNAIQRIPWFYKEKDGTIRSVQGKFFGFYALRNMLRGTMIGVTYFLSGISAAKEGFNAPAISMFYTSCFHSLVAYLAINGRVIIEIVNGPPQIVEENDQTGLLWRKLDHKSELMIGVFTRKGRWVFEGRSRSHGVIWRELKKILSESNFELPDYLSHFFEYVISYGPVDISDHSKNFVENALDQLIGMRHQALYEGFGFDDFAFDQMINQDGMGFGIQTKSRQYNEFAKSLIMATTTATHDLISEMSKEVRDSLLLYLTISVFTPPFEVHLLSKDYGSDPNMIKFQRIAMWIIGQGNQGLTWEDLQKYGA